MVIDEVFSYVKNSFGFASIFVSCLFYFISSKPVEPPLLGLRDHAEIFYFLYPRAYKANRYFSFRRVVLRALFFVALIFTELTFMVLSKVAKISSAKMLQIR